MSMCRVFSCVVGRGRLLRQSILLAKLYISLCPASFRTPSPNLPVTPGVSWLPIFAFQSPRMKRTSFWVLVLEGLIGLHGTIQLQDTGCWLLSIYLCPSYNYFLLSSGKICATRGLSPLSVSPAFLFFWLPVGFESREALRHWGDERESV